MGDRHQYEWPYGKDMASFWADLAGPVGRGRELMEMLGSIVAAALLIAVACFSVVVGVGAGLFVLERLWGRKERRP